MSVIKVTLKVVTKKKASTVMAIGDNSVQERKIEAPLLDPFKKQTGSFDSFITGKQKKCRGQREAHSTSIKKHRAFIGQF